MDVHLVMNERITLRIRVAKTAAVAIVALSAMAMPAVVAILHMPTVRAQSSPRPQFEAAAIKACPKGASEGRSGGAIAPSSPVRLSLACEAVYGLIKDAYFLFANGRYNASGAMRTGTIEGGPSWINSEYYQITAKAETAASQAIMNGPMLQKLLEDRFKLKIHVETREVPVYNLAIAKNGPKLQSFKEGACVPFDFTVLSAPLPDGQKNCVSSANRSGPNMVVDVQGMSMDDLARNVFIELDRPVVNKTGLTGRFDFRLEYALADRLRSMMARNGRDPGESTAPEIFSAIQEQLGLKLEPAKGPGEFLVIDHIERPSEN